MRYVGRDVPTVAPYGSWSSPLSLEVAATAGGVRFSAVSADERGVYWLENRPDEQGRSALVFCPHGGTPEDVVPPGFNVRTRVHEYGGGAWFRDGEVLFCSSFDDSRLYRIDGPGAEPPHDLLRTGGERCGETLCPPAAADQFGGGD